MNEEQSRVLMDLTLATLEEIEFEIAMLIVEFKSLMRDDDEALDGEE